MLKRIQREVRLHEKYKETIKYARRKNMSSSELNNRLQQNSKIFNEQLKTKKGGKPPPKMSISFGAQNMKPHLIEEFKTTTKKTENVQKNIGHLFVNIEQPFLEEISQKAEKVFKRKRE